MHPMPPIQHAETQVKVQYDSPTPLNLKSTIGSSQFCVCGKLEIRTNFRCTPFHEFSADPGATRGDDIAVPMSTFSQAVDTHAGMCIREDLKIRDCKILCPITPLKI